MRPAPLLICVFLCLAAAARGQDGGARLSPKQLARAEGLLDALGRTEALAARPPSAADGASLRKLSASVRDSARHLPEGVVRSDIETAARQLELTGGAGGALPATCEGERPGAYRRLCAESGTADELRLRKARLHVAWARAYVRRERGAAGADEARVLAEAEAEREAERRLAESAFESLSELERVVVVYRTLADFEEGGALARVPFEGFEGRFAQTAEHVGAVLDWLPETRLRSELRNALRSYADGRFWWAKVHCARILDARAGDCVSEVERWRLGAGYPAAANYAVAVNWRNASKHLGRAAKLLDKQSQLLTHDGASPSTRTTPAALLFKP